MKGKIGTQCQTIHILPDRYFTLNGKRKFWKRLPNTHTKSIPKSEEELLKEAWRLIDKLKH